MNFPQSPLLVFDIETVPDIAIGKATMAPPPGGWSSDAEVAETMFAAQLERTKGASSFLKHSQHQIVAISVIYRAAGVLKIASLGTHESIEAELLSAFFETIDKKSPILVDWNGGGFDLPVIQLRALKHGISSFTYWNTGGDARWENYHDRYRGKHIDLMDTIGRFNVKSSLDDVAALIGAPGKIGMDGSKVWSAHQAGEIKAIRNYCDHDVLTTYLVFLRLELIRGRLTKEAYELEIELLVSTLEKAGAPHFQEYLASWAAPRWPR